MKDNKMMNKKEMDNNKNIFLLLSDDEIFDVDGGWIRKNVIDDTKEFLNKFFNLNN